MLLFLSGESFEVYKSSAFDLFSELLMVEAPTSKGLCRSCLKFKQQQQVVCLFERKKQPANNKLQIQGVYKTSNSI